MDVEQFFGGRALAAATSKALPQAHMSLGRLSKIPCRIVKKVIAARYGDALRR
jgi:hypothetical protein